MLQALGYKNVSTHHMNEGHAAFLTLALLEREAARGDLAAVAETDCEAVRQRSVFTTHTPVETPRKAIHDNHSDNWQCLLNVHSETLNACCIRMLRVVRLLRGLLAEACVRRQTVLKSALGVATGPRLIPAG